MEAAELPKNGLQRLEGGPGALLLYAVTFLAASALFYLRFPNNFTEPNFFAEDGKNFAATLLEQGLLPALGQRFNGYFIWGIYLVGQLGRGLNALLYGGVLVTLPQSFALASYAFLGFVASMPLWLFRTWLPLRIRLPWVALNCFVPMVVSDYAVIGTIGNLKYAFVFIAFLLIVYRHRLAPSDPGVFAVDLGLLVCAYTNGTVYLLTPLLLVRYLAPLKAQGLRALLRDRSFLSLLVLGLGMVPQIAVIAIAGIEKHPGYLDTPFVRRAFVETFVHRSYSYGLFYWLRPANDFAALALFTLLAAAILYFVRREHRVVVTFAFLAVLATTGLFVAARPGIGETFAHYAHGSFDQFFYAQNWIAYAAVAFAVHGAFEGRAPVLLARWAPALVLLAFLVPLRKSGSWGRGGAMREHVGSLYDLAPSLCARREARIEVPIYPRHPWTMEVSRAELCTPRAIAGGRW